MRAGGDGGGSSSTLDWAAPGIGRAYLLTRGHDGSGVAVTEQGSLFQREREALLQQREEQQWRPPLHLDQDVLRDSRRLQAHDCMHLGGFTVNVGGGDGGIGSAGSGGARRGEGGSGHGGGDLEQTGMEKIIGRFVTEMAANRAEMRRVGLALCLCVLCECVHERVLYI